MRRGCGSVGFCRLSFNPRTREDATQSLKALFVDQAGFNPRTREDATYADLDDLDYHLGFNPRTREDATYQGFY